VYQGPREDVLEFFESVGFKCPERTGVADFLQEASMLDFPSPSDVHVGTIINDKPLCAYT
jgi:hypothetical protein